MIDLYFEIRKRICPFDEVANQIPLKKKILDIGCGNGILYKYFLDNKDYISYTGIDKNLKKLQKLQQESSGNAFFLDRKIEDILEDIKNYDCILMIDVMHHVNKKYQKMVIENILINMNKGSTLIYKDISNKNFIKSLINRIHDLVISFQLISYYESSKIIKFAKEELKIDSIKKFNIQVLWYDHEFLIINK